MPRTVTEGRLRGPVRRPSVTCPDEDRAAVVGTSRHRPHRTHPRHASQDGAVAAEAAVVIPVLVAVALGLVWLVALAATQVRVVDAARETARLAARGEPDRAAQAHGARVAPDGTRFRITHSHEVVQVRASAPVAGPGGLFGFLPRVEVESTAVAAREPR